MRLLRLGVASDRSVARNVPGLVGAIFGALAALIIFLTPVQFGRVNLDAGTLVVACVAVIIGVQFVAFALFSKAFAVAEGLLPPDPRFARFARRFTLERGLTAGLLIFLTGVALFIWAVGVWAHAGFGALPYEENLRRIMAAATCVTVGLQIMGASWFLSVLGLKTTRQRDREGGSEAVE